MHIQTYMHTPTYMYICRCTCVLTHSVVRLFATPWTIAARLLCPWDFPSKNTRVGCHFLLQRILPTQQSNPCLLHWQVDSVPPAPPGKLQVHARNLPNLKYGCYSPQMLLRALELNRVHQLVGKDLMRV